MKNGFKWRVHPWQYLPEEKAPVRQERKFDMKKWWVIAVLAGWTVCYGEAGLEKSTVKALADRVRTHQIKQGLRFKNQHWVRGTYYAGLMAMYESTSDRDYLDDCMEWRPRRV